MTEDTAMGPILFYDSATRAGASVVRDRYDNLLEQREFGPGTFGAWTHIRLR